MRDNCKSLKTKQDSMVSMVKQYGIGVLSNEHLLAAILGIDAMNHGYQEVVEILDHTHSLRKASCKTFNDLVSIKGIGEKKATAMLAAFELGKRLMQEKAESREDLGCSIFIYQHMLPYMKDLEVEEFWILLMNQNFKLIKKVRISVGGITECAADIRLIMKEVVINNATILAVCHNHPSNNPFPSKKDNLLTAEISKACDIMHIYFMDHVIVSDGAFYSYHDKGKL